MASGVRSATRRRLEARRSGLSIAAFAGISGDSPPWPCTEETEQTRQEDVLMLRRRVEESTARLFGCNAV